ncbi:hypothetical protein Ddye_025891 [Dipteronia dyeriana]|uniref:Protein FAR1-RELATED SEQUENCE n=1 Tax=Dipteronia dyeriana TaxID=168575 RepID=A0AAD9TL81_9ROSI|nr:hypothetical protein Ddye_025891 [Dipteronia dyeriana]
MDNHIGMFSTGTGHLDLNSKGYLRWDDVDTTYIDNEELKKTDTSNNNEWPYSVPFGHGNVSTPLCLSGDNLVQPTDDRLNSELISLQDSDFMRKEFISVTDAEEFYKKYSYVMGFSMRKDRTNAYNRPLVIFAGVNHYTKMAIFGFELLVDETTNVCDTWFTQAYTHDMLAYMTEAEFETQWFNPIERFGLQHNEWVKTMYCKRKLWAKTFLQSTFFGGLWSTQRSESMNSFLNCFLNSRLKLYKFISHIDREMSCLRNNELKDDFDSINEHPVLLTHLLQLEKHVAKV